MLADHERSRHRNYAESCKQRPQWRHDLKEVAYSSLPSRLSSSVKGFPILPRQIGHATMPLAAPRTLAMTREESPTDDHSIRLVRTVFLLRHGQHTPEAPDDFGRRLLEAQADQAAGARSTSRKAGSSGRPTSAVSCRTVAGGFRLRPSPPGSAPGRTIRSRTPSRRSRQLGDRPSELRTRNAASATNPNSGAAAHPRTGHSLAGVRSTRYEAVYHSATTRGVEVARLHPVLLAGAVGPRDRPLVVAAYEEPLRLGGRLATPDRVRSADSA